MLDPSIHSPIISCSFRSSCLIESWAWRYLNRGITAVLRDRLFKQRISLWMLIYHFFFVGGHQWTKVIQACPYFNTSWNRMSGQLLGSLTVCPTFTDSASNVSFVCSSAKLFRESRHVWSQGSLRNALLRLEGHFRTDGDGHQCHTITTIAARWRLFHIVSLCPNVLWKSCSRLRYLLHGSLAWLSALLYWVSILFS